MQISTRLVDHPQVSVQDIDHDLPHGIAERLPAIIETADQAFWSVVAEHLPEIKSGDVAPDGVMARERDNVRAVVSWVRDNLPMEVTAEHVYASTLHALRDRGLQAGMSQTGGGCLAIEIPLDLEATGIEGYVLLTTEIGPLTDERQPDEHWHIGIYRTTEQGNDAVFNASLPTVDRAQDDEEMARSVRALLNLIWREP